MLRPILSVILGYLARTAVWFGGGAALFALFPGEPSEQGELNSPVLLLAFLVLSVICSLIGGAVCSKIARSRSTVPPAVLAGLLLLTGLGVQISAWDTMPLWYHAPFLLLLAPVTIAGARLAAPSTGARR